MASSNADRFKSDLKRLLDQGAKLDLAIVHETDPDGFKKQAVAQVGAKGAVKVIENLPNFKTAYEGWYSEALILLKQFLPDRMDNFIGLYEKPKNRKSIQYGNYVMQDYMQNLRVSYLGETQVDASAAVPQFRQQLAIVRAAERRFDSSLFELRQLVQADIFDKELDAARELLSHKFVRAAGAVAGVLLEKHLNQVATEHRIAMRKKNPTISDLNELLKANGVVGIPEWRHISLLGDLRNLCDHDKKREPSVEQVRDLIDGTDKVLRTIS